MHELYDKVAPIFSKYQSDEHVEFEMRLGKINRGAFDTNVGQHAFDKIYKGLKKYSGWENVMVTNDVAYYHDAIRLIVNDDTDESIQVHKQKLEKIDHLLKHAPYDVRFAVAKEIPYENGDIEFTSARHRNRESFIRKNLSIDMTIVSGNPADLDSEEENSYQVEFEIIDSTKVRDRDTLYNIIYKIQDVLKLI